MQATCVPLFQKFLIYPYIVVIFPSYGKILIIPLHKSGSKIEVSNYRGIAKLSAIPKLFEKIITDQITHAVSSSISISQHGFLKRRSTSTNLLEFTTRVLKGFTLGQCYYTDVIYTDFEKAFDTLDHSAIWSALTCRLYSPGI